MLNAQDQTGLEKLVADAMLHIICKLKSIFMLPSFCIFLEFVCAYFFCVKWDLMDINKNITHV